MDNPEVLRSAADQLRTWLRFFDRSSGAALERMARDFEQRAAEIEGRAPEPAVSPEPCDGGDARPR